MTYKKSLISIAAAGVIAATLTGCGSSSSTSSTANGSSASVQAVDGYILNGKAVATYVDTADSNKTKTVTYENVKTSTNVITNVVTPGSTAYTIADANASVLDSVRFITITANAADVKDGESYPATFIDVDGSNDYNASKDEAYNLTLRAPVGYSYVTPVSTLVYELAKADLGDNTTDINATALQNAADKIAAKLNITADDIKAVDPISKAEYGFVNAMLGNEDLVKLAADLDKEDSNASDFAGVISLLAKQATTGALFGALDAQVKSGDLKAADLTKYNWDKVRAKGGDLILNEGSATAFADINVTTLNGEDLDTVLNTGDKIKDDTALLKIGFQPRAKDESNATATVDLIIYAGKPQNSVEDKATGSNIAIKVSNIDLIKTDGTPVLDYNSSKIKTSYEWYSEEQTNIKSNYVSLADKNDTVLDISGAFTNLKSKGEINLISLFDTIDTNASTTDNNATALDLLSGKIADVKVAIIDASGALQNVDSDGNAISTGKVSIAGQNSQVSGEGMKILNLKGDTRAARTGTNNAPTITTIGGSAKGATVVTDYANASKATTNPFTIVIDENSDVEQNSTVTVSGLPTWVTVTKATVVGAASNADFNLTKDSNLTIGDTNTTVKFSVADEFGKKGDDANISFFFNALAKVSLTSGTGVTNFKGNSVDGYTVDVNATENNNTAIVFKITNMMGEANTTITSDLNTTITLATEVNATSGIGKATITDLNASSEAAGTKTITIDETMGTLQDVTVDLNISH